jgi:hypothetical protein
VSKPDSVFLDLSTCTALVSTFFNRPYKQAAVDLFKEKIIGRVARNMGFNEPVDSMFSVGWTLTCWSYQVRSGLGCCDNVDETVKKVIRGEIAKPDWMFDVEYKYPVEELNTFCFLYITPKDEKYVPIASRVEEIVKNRKKVYA